MHFLSNKKHRWNSISAFLLPLVLFGLFINLTIAVMPIYMMQVFDRVIPTGNLETLALLTIAALGVLAFGSYLDHLRASMLSALGIIIEDHHLRHSFTGSARADQREITRLRKVRNFIEAGQLTAVLDIPWLSIFLFALFMLDAALFFAAGALILGLLFIQYLQQTLYRSGAELDREMKTLDAALDPLTKSAGLSRAMGLGKNIIERFLSKRSKLNGLSLLAGLENSKRNFAKNVIRQMGQISAIGIGAILVSKGESSPGTLIAASLLTVKSISMADAAVRALRSRDILRLAFQNLPKEVPQSPSLNADAKGHLTFESVSLPDATGKGFRLRNITLDLEPGRVLGIIGASGAGKTSILKLAAGLESASFGRVCFDGHNLASFGPEDLCRLIGYMPQIPRFETGTIAENIASFACDIDQETVEDAARLAGLHARITNLKHGYHTDLALSAEMLTASQQQSLALARAVYHRPKLLLMDEPSALMDRNGEHQLSATLSFLKSKQVTTIIASKNLGVFWQADELIVLDQGQIIDQGSKKEVLARRKHDDRRIVVTLNPESLRDIEDWIKGQFSRATDQELRQQCVIDVAKIFASLLETRQGRSNERVAITFNFKGADTALIGFETAHARIARRVKSLAVDLHKSLNAQDGAQRRAEAAHCEGISDLRLLPVNENGVRFEVEISEAAPLSKEESQTHG